MCGICAIAGNDDVSSSLYKGLLALDIEATILVASPFLMAKT